jgi:hypothetical protein
MHYFPPNGKNKEKPVFYNQLERGGNMKSKVILLMLTLMLILSACKTATVPAGSPSPTPTAAEPQPPEPTLQPTSPSPEGPVIGESVSDYFPMKENVHMKYAGAGNEFAEYETYVDYLSGNTIQIRTINPGTVSISVYTIKNGALKKVHSEGEIYYRQDFTGIPFELEDILIQEPIAVGNSWPVDDGATRSITAVDADVQVPYGAFKALEVTTEGNDYIIKHYYAPGVGLIKTEFSSKDSPESVISSELDFIEEGQPYRQNVRFYFPDAQAEGLVYQEREIALFTGDDISAKLEEQMKLAPAGLQPVISENTKVRKVSVDKATKVATIDLSSDFVSDMNAGSTLEDLLLKSVASTVGSYFQTNMVTITIEGQPYESGHFAFKKGEYLTVDPENIPEYQ